VAKCVWEGMVLGQGTGRSKKQAETAAAANAMKQKVWDSETKSQT
jgi:dsRNA-specific ribonuclease